MAPKGKQQEPAKKKTTVDDKTFGMKNKKGGAAQKNIKQLQAQAKSNVSPEEKKKQAEKEQREKDKAAAEAAKREALDLFKPVQVQKVPFGVDPKTVLCQFFKAGHCDKGKKCKFSHDLGVQQKTSKKDLYQDEKDNEKENDKMEDWDEEKLKKVVMSKHGNPKTTTDKVCKYFVQAIEEGKYGWFWTCPNGGEKCMYRHSLPPGFVVKTKEQRAAEKALMDKSPLNTLTLEDFLESERHKLSGGLTPVTPDSFAKWKKERMDKKTAEEEARKAKEATGRAMFESGDWKDSEDEDSEEEEDDDSEDDGQDAWDMEAMRKETERLRQLKEEERLGGGGGEPLPDDSASEDGGSGVDGSDETDEAQPESSRVNGGHEESQVEAAAD